MSLLLKIAISSAAAVVLCGLSYQIIGSEVRPDGELREAFIFIPLAWFFATIGLVCGVAHVVLRR